MKLSNKIRNFIYKQLYDVSQASTVEIDDGLMSSAETIALCRSLAAEGCVLLKNDEVLPISQEEPVAVFGRCQKDYFYVGYGSGGDVKPPYKISPLEAFKASGVKFDEELANIYEEWIALNPPDDGVWGNWPMCYDEMPLNEDIVAKTAERCRKAIVFIGRSSGEDREAKKKEGSWYLTKEEELMLSLVSKSFEKVCVVLNCGAIFDTSWIEKYSIKAVLYAWQGGQESGRAIVDVLTGRVNPSGKLTDTIADIEDYPSTANFGDKKKAVYSEDIFVGYRYFETFNPGAVKYPFGFGLSYTTFSVKGELVAGEDTTFKVKTTVTNTGGVVGKEVVQVYVGAPEGVLGKASKELVAFVKTKEIEPGKKTQNTIEVDLREFASYDDTGLTGYKNAYILEAGEYKIYVGTDVRSASLVGTTSIEETLVRQTREVCPPMEQFERLVCRNGKEMYMPVEVGTRNLKERVMKQVPLPMQKIKGVDYKLCDVKAGKISMDEFVASLSTDDLEALSRGSFEAMNSPYGAPGNAAAFGGVTKSLIYKGVPSISVNDGPSGARLQAHSTLFPIGAVLSSSFNVELVEKTMKALGAEVVERNSHVLLAPGLNIHRNPLCGRNFEYFSEDTYLTGEMAIACVKGIQASGCSAVPKHFCCNNQETGRTHNDSVVSQRALREIYLRAFEKCIKESKPDFLMTSYNKINGVYSYYNYDVCTVLLRDEFGFDGIIMTDWWMKDGKIDEFPDVTNQALRVRAGNNLFMPGGPQRGKKKETSIYESLKKDDGLSLGELQRNAKIVLEYCLRFV